MKSRSLYKLAIVIGLGNYLLCAFTLLTAGGDALHGYVSEGRYFLASDGAFVEVGRALFLLCKWQAYSLLLTFPLGLLGASFLRPEADGAELIGGHANARLSPHAS